MRLFTSVASFKAKKAGLKALIHYLILIPVFAAGVFGAAPVAAQIAEIMDCAGTVNPNLNCTSNDIKINDVSQMTEIEGGQPILTECNEGESGFLDIRLTTQLNATGRYDVISWFGTQGNDPRGATLGNCYASSLPDDPDSPFILDLDIV